MSKRLRIACVIGFLYCSALTASPAFGQGEGTKAVAACLIEGSDNCQLFDDILSFALSDRHFAGGGVLTADDFVPLDTTLTDVCACGFYIDGDPEVSSADDDCGPQVSADQFRIRVYTNDDAPPTGTGRKPKTKFAESTATSVRAVVPGSELFRRIQNNMYGYQIHLDTPITGLTVGTIYWLEISNDPTISGPPMCMWFWSQKTQTSTSYSFSGTNAGYAPSFESPSDFAFCTNFALQPSELGSQTGACCQCDGSCSAKTLVDCDNVNGIWHIESVSCAGITCPAGPPANDNCVDGPTVITDGDYTFSNQCATTDGYWACIWDDFGFEIDFDLWYAYTAMRTCDLTISMCPTGTRFDSAMVVYHDSADPIAYPPCPLDYATSVATTAGGCQDESCIGVAVGGAGFWTSLAQIGRPALPGECFLIRVGSFPGSRGTGILSVSCIETAPPPPVADPAGINKPRFISFSVPAGSGSTAMRVKLTSLHHVNPPYTNGASTPFTLFETLSQFVGPPGQYICSACIEAAFYASKLQCEPYYQDWTTITLLHVTGEAIVPSSVYEVQNLAASCMGSEASCTAVSTPLSIVTTRWGDVVDAFNPPSTTSQPDFTDIGALVNKFKGAPGAPIKARAMLAGENARGLINLTPDLGFGHISACVDGFKGMAYPYKPGKCTGVQTMACITDADCGANGPCILCP